MSMPHGATCVDFAYAVHTDIGNHCVAAKINHELVPLRTELTSGDRVEIITAAHAKPNPAWLNFVVTSKARSRIRHVMKNMQYEESSKLGERLLGQALVALKSAPDAITEEQWAQLLKTSAAKSRDEVLADIGLGKQLAVVIARQLLSIGEHDGATRQPGSLVIHGSEGMALQFAKCGWTSNGIRVRRSCLRSACECWRRKGVAFWPKLLPRSQRPSRISRA